MSHECRCGEVDASGIGSSRNSAYPMMEVSEATRLVLAEVAKLADTPTQKHQYLPLAQAVGHVSAQDRHATQPFPAFPASTMDGYAIIAADGVGTFSVVSAVTAGRSLNASFTLQRGQMVYITTGAPVPNGADAVLPIEWTDVPDAAHPGQVRTLQAVEAGANIRPVGSDITAGQTLLRGGQLIGPAEIGLMASVGMHSLQVISAPRVGVMSSGDEVVDVSSAAAMATATANTKGQQAELGPAFGEIYDSNRPMLLALAESVGATAVDLGLVKDDAAELEKRVLGALATVDILVLSGGVSMGARDFVKPLLAKLGQVHFGRLNMKPGKPTTFATVRLPGTEIDKLVFGLPGNPVSALVTAQLLLVPAIKAWRIGGAAAGVTPRTHGYPILPVRLASTLSPDSIRPEYHRVHVRWDDAAGEWVAKSTGGQMSSRMLSCTSANGLVRVEANQKDFVAGAGAKALLVGDWNMPEFVAPPLPQRKLSQMAAVAAGAPVLPPKPQPAALAAGQSSAAGSSSTPAVASAAAVGAGVAAVPVFELRVAILTVSDRCSSGAATDLSGPAIASLLAKASLKNTKVTVVAQSCVPDEVDAIQKIVKGWTDASAASDASFPQLILTTGGTGFSPRDVTPEAIKGILEREASGLVFAMMQASMAATPMGALSRPVAGTRARTLILTLPGSPKAIPEILQPILNIIPHAVKLLQATDDPHTLPSPQPKK